MKVRNINIEIKSFDKLLGEVRDVMEKIQDDKPVKPKKETLSFPSIDEFRRFFTNKRLELLKTINHHNPQSVYQLAKLVKRDIKSVNTDLEILKDVGLVDLKKTKKRVTPNSKYDKLIIEVVL